MKSRGQVSRNSTLRSEHLSIENQEVAAASTDNVKRSRYDEFRRRRRGESHPFGPISLTLPNAGTLNSLSKRKQRSLALSEEVSERPRS